MLLLLRRCCSCAVVVALPAPRPRFWPLFTATMPPRKRTIVAPSASASSGSEFEASPAPKAKKAKASASSNATAASKKSPASKKKKSPVDDGPKGLAPGWIKYGPYVIAK